MCTNRYLDRINICEFFSLLNGKVEERKIQLIAAAMAETVARGGIQRVIDGSEIPASRLASLRRELRERQRELTTA